MLLYPFPKSISLVTSSPNGDRLVFGNKAVIIFSDGLRRDASERHDDGCKTDTKRFDILDEIGVLIVAKLASRYFGDVPLESGAQGNVFDAVG